MGFAPVAGVSHRKRQDCGRRSGVRVTTREPVTPWRRRKASHTKGGIPATDREGPRRGVERRCQGRPFALHRRRFSPVGSPAEDPLRIGNRTAAWRKARPTPRATVMERRRAGRGWWTAGLALSPGLAADEILGRLASPLHYRRGASTLPRAHPTTDGAPFCHGRLGDRLAGLGDASESTPGLDAQGVGGRAGSACSSGLPGALEWLQMP